MTQREYVDSMMRLQRELHTNIHRMYNMKAGHTPQLRQICGKLNNDIKTLSQTMMNQGGMTPEKTQTNLYEHLHKTNKKAIKQLVAVSNHMNALKVEGRYKEFDELEHKLGIAFDRLGIENALDFWFYMKGKGYMVDNRETGKLIYK